MFKALNGSYREPLATKETAKALGLEALMVRLEERESWADSIRILWNEISPQVMGAKTADNGSRYMLRLRSTLQADTDGEITILDLDGKEVTIQSAMVIRKSTRNDPNKILVEMPDKQKHRNEERHNIGRYMDEKRDELREAEAQLAILAKMKKKEQDDLKMTETLEKKRDYLEWLIGDLKLKYDALI